MRSRTAVGMRLVVGLVAVSILGAACGDDGGTSAETDPAGQTNDMTAPEAPDFGDISVICAAGFTEGALAIAIEQGILEEHGIDASCVQVASGPERAATLISGEAQFSADLPNNIVTVLDEGFEIVAFHEQFSAQVFDLLVREGYPLPNADEGWEGVMRDLEGAKIGVVARGAAAEDIARTLFEGAGVDPDAQTYIATGVVAPTTAALQSGQVDAAITFEPALSLAERDGWAVRPFSLQEGDGPDDLHWPGLVWSASREFAEENPDLVCAFRDSLNEAVAFMNDEANHDEVVDILQRFTGTEDRAITELILENNGQYMSADGTIDVSQFDSIGQLVADLGKVSRVYGADEWVVGTDC